jgi:hypothetical protein
MKNNEINKTYAIDQKLLAKIRTKQNYISQSKYFAFFFLNCKLTHMKVIHLKKNLKILIKSYFSFGILVQLSI